MTTLTRVLQTVQETLSHTFRVGETATDPTGTPTVAIKRLDGTAVTSGNATVVGSGTGRVTFTLPGQADLDTFTVDWTGIVAGSARTERDFVEIAGGFLFDLAEAREVHDLDEVKYPAEVLAARRVEVEQECERICYQAFVPRFSRVALTGRGTRRLTVPIYHTMLRVLRAVTVDGVAWSAPEVAAVILSDGGVLRLPNAVWPADASIVVEYEHGLDFPPGEIRTQTMARLKSLLGQPTSAIPSRAISYSVPDGNTYRLSTPNRERTGIPDIDAAYERNLGPKRMVFA